MENPFSDRAMATYWTDMIRDDINPYRKFVTDPALFRRLEMLDCPSRILDAGCGEGYLVRWLEEQGHQVMGVDLSLALLEAARSASGRDGKFACGDAFQMPFADETFDCVVSNFLLMDLADPDYAIREIGRVLKSGGRFIFQILHPFCFTTNSGQNDNRVVKDYFTTAVYREKFVVDGRESPQKSIRYHHPLSRYTQALNQSGCHIVSLEEPRPIEATAVDHPVREIMREPWFLLIDAVKEA